MSPIVLIVLDGWGIAPPGSGNAITLARPPFYQQLWRTGAHASLAASGSAVGLPARQFGNSEAGHMNIGAGRVVEQDAVRISSAIRDGGFTKNEFLHKALRAAKARGQQLHLLGLLTKEESGHVYPQHLTELLKLAGRRRVSTRLHLFTDGRDTSKFEAVNLLRRLNRQLGPDQRIVTLIGRVWAMDRAKRWSRTEAAWNAMVLGKGKSAVSAEQAVLDGYKRGENDEFLAPTVLGMNAADRQATRIHHGDAVILFHLRSDRARQLAKPFVQARFEVMNPGAFPRGKRLRKLTFVALTDFGPDLPNILTAFPNEPLDGTLPMALGDLRQLYIAESEKYAHVTYFFNGGYPQSVAGEERIMLPSTNALSFDEQPGMQTSAITTVVVEKLRQRRFDVMVANFANADMVGHTGNLKAAIKAVTIIDRSLSRLARAVKKAEGTLIITGDHGNIEEMLHEPTGEVNTEHSGNPVPFLLSVSHRPLPRLRSSGKLADVAPTILHFLGRKPPDAMTGRSLLLR